MLLQEPRAALNTLHPPLLPVVNGLWIALVLVSMVAIAKYIVTESVPQTVHHQQPQRLVPKQLLSHISMLKSVPHSLAHPSSGNDASTVMLGLLILAPHQHVHRSLHHRKHLQQVTRRSVASSTTAFGVCGLQHGLCPALDIQCCIACASRSGPAATAVRLCCARCTLCLFRLHLQGRGFSCDCGHKKTCHTYIYACIS